MLPKDVAEKHNEFISTVRHWIAQYKTPMHAQYLNGHIRRFVDTSMIPAEVKTYLNLLISIRVASIMGCPYFIQHNGNMLLAAEDGTPMKSRSKLLLIPTVRRIKSENVNVEIINDGKYYYIKEAQPQPEANDVPLFV